MQWDMLMGDKGKESSNPLVMPRPGHQALLLAAGALNGADLGDDVILKGGSEKITVDIEVEGQNKRIERETIVSRLSVLNTKTGEYETWRADTDRDKTVKWFEDHGETLAAAIKREHNPTFDGDLSPFDFSQLTAPGCLPGKDKPEFFPQQMEAAAA